MNRVIEGIERGDRACICIGIDFIEEEGKFAFGKILKSNTARALRRTALDPEQKNRIRQRLLHMLVSGNVPHEYKQYARLFKKVGIDPVREAIEAHVDHENPYVMQYVRYLLSP